MTFQRVIGIVLQDAKLNYAMAYMDDVVVFSKTLDEHLIHLTTVLQQMQDAGITINPPKVQLVSTRINLLGFIVEQGTVRPDEEKLQAILQLAPPTDVKSLQQFLDMVGFYHHFIPNCADLAGPIHQLLRKGARWYWTVVEQRSFRALSSAVADTARLRLPNLNRPFTVQTDASEYGISAVLLQEHQGKLCPLAFVSHTLTGAERNYMP